MVVADQRFAIPLNTVLETLACRVPAVVVPYAAGIPGKVRIIYLPTSAPAVVKNLEPGATYRAAYFDPVSGKRIDLPKAARGDSHGSWIIPTPSSEGRPDKCSCGTIFT